MSCVTETRNGKIALEYQHDVGVMHFKCNFIKVLVINKQYVSMCAGIGGKKDRRYAITGTKDDPSH